VERRQIEIKRNIIEQSIMYIMDFINKNRKKFFISCISILVSTIIVFCGILIYEKFEYNELIQFEKVLEIYRDSYMLEEKARKEVFQKTIIDLKIIIDSSYWGYVHENGLYILAGIYHGEKDYSKAKEYYLKFVNRAPSSFFASLALHQAGIMSEYIGDYNKAMQIYQQLEKEYSNSVIADEILYDLGRIFQINGDTLKSREYYNKVISLYPQSIFTNKAKKRLFMLAYYKKNLK